MYSIYIDLIFSKSKGRMSSKFSSRWPPPRIRRSLRQYWVTTMMYTHAREIPLLLCICNPLRRRRFRNPVAFLFDLPEVAGRIKNTYGIFFCSDWSRKRSAIVSPQLYTHTHIQRVHTDKSWSEDRTHHKEGGKYYVIHIFIYIFIYISFFIVLLSSFFIYISSPLAFQYISPRLCVFSLYWYIEAALFFWYCYMKKTRCVLDDKNVRIFIFRYTERL